MTLARFEMLMAVVEQESLTGAAQVLGCTQSAVSHGIEALEKELGFAVLKRSRAGVKLTAEGERLLPAVRGLLNSAEQLEQQAASIRGLEAGTVRIGAFTSVAVHWLPGVLKEFQTDYPKVDFKLLNGDYHDVEQWLSDGSVDIGFVNLPCELDCEYIPLMEDRLLAILPEDHPLADCEVFPVEQIDREPFILQGKGLRAEAEDFFEQHGLHPAAYCTTWDDYAIMSLVERGVGISLLPELILKRTPYHIVIKELSVSTSRDIGFAVRDKKTASLAVKRFMEYLRYRYNVKKKLNGLPASFSPRHHAPCPTAASSAVSPMMSLS